MPSLRDDARAIWQAGVAAVDSRRLVRQAVRAEGDRLTVADETFDLSQLGRICVVGAGKAGAGMARGLEEALGPALLDRISGWVNVPADCVRPLKKITLHAARPAGVNEPTEDGVRGTEEILSRVSSLGPDDLCLVLLSGGGSALLPGPAPPVTLDEKQRLTRRLAAAGATIHELNTVRKQLSAVKAGRLAARITAGRTVVLIISDVIGDPLDVIASGPTVADTATPADAEAVLRRLLPPEDVPESIWERLRAAGPPPAVPETVRNVVIGSNRTAVAAASAEARRRGYDVKDIGSSNDGEAAAWGTTLAEAALDARRRHSRPFCLVGGGETTVNLGSADHPRRGGRNQEVALAAIVRLWDEPADGVIVLSGGTDGEDGPTDAAGAVADLGVIVEGRRKRLAPREFLASHDSYWFFDATGGLIKTGPTHTNVMDLQVVLSEPRRRRLWVPTKDRIEARRAEEAAARPPGRRTSKPTRRG
jgi:glycerate-2-kinase